MWMVDMFTSIERLCMHNDRMLSAVSSNFIYMCLSMRKFIVLNSIILLASFNALSQKLYKAPPEGTESRYTTLYGCGNLSNSPETITLKSLLSDMLDRQDQTVFPRPGYKSMQASSWDRSQKTRNDSATWFANVDYNNYIRLVVKNGQRQYIILDEKGPGVITRWWIPQENTLQHRILRIYIDDDSVPAIEENYEKFMNGSLFIKWPFAFTSSDENNVKYQYGLPVGMKQVGASFYFPIAFQKRCKITLNDQPFFYVINYRKYAKGTRVESFSKNLLEKYSDFISKTSQMLLRDQKSNGNLIEQSTTLLNGQTIKIDLPDGPHAIEFMELKISPLHNKQLSRSAVIEISFDNQLCVWSPVAEFFGGGVYTKPVQNFKMQVNDDGTMISKWVMPYRKQATLIVRNYGEQAMNAKLKVSVKHYNWTPNSMYFHAMWHEEAPLRPPLKKDWNYIEIKGKGRFSGDVLTVYSDPKIWWGEGDEKVYIDNDSFPSHLGTGLEDYYGYAWGMANFFSSPFISMPERDARGKGDWRGYNTMSRIRLLDDIVFNQSFKLDIEAWLMEKGVSFSVCIFWYSLGNSKHNIIPDKKTILRKLADFEPAPLQQLPGEVFADPQESEEINDGKIFPINYVGKYRDLLEWRDKGVNKSLDVDGDNVVGSLGYILMGDKVATFQGLVVDTAYKLPSFIKSLEARQSTAYNGNACLFFPEKNSEMHVTGLVEMSGGEAENGVCSFSLNRNTPSSFRLGVMLDNAGSFNKVGKWLWLEISSKGRSKRVALIRFNRVPDWYFFDCYDLHAGDRITIYGSTEKGSDIFSIGGLTFDVNK